MIGGGYGEGEGGDGEGGDGGIAEAEMSLRHEEGGMDKIKDCQGDRKVILCSESEGRWRRRSEEKKQKRGEMRGLTHYNKGEEDTIPHCSSSVTI